MMKYLPGEQVELLEKAFWYTLIDVPRDDSQFCTYGLLYIPGKQCLGESVGKTVGGELKTKKAYETYESLIK